MAKPEVTFGYAGQFLPDNIKVKKKLVVWPVVFSFSWRWHLESLTSNPKVSCKDVFVKGKLVYSASNRCLEYRKRIGLPMLGSRLGAFVATARWKLDDVGHTLKPQFHIGFEFRKGKTEVQMNAVKFKPRLFITKHIGFEAQSKLSFQLPSQLLFEVAGNDHSIQNDDDDHLGVRLDLEELNVVVRL